MKVCKDQREIKVLRELKVSKESRVIQVYKAQLELVVCRVKLVYRVKEV
jgi:hypothetical protein